LPRVLRRSRRPPEHGRGLAAYLVNIDAVPLLRMPGLSRFKTVIRPLDRA
jgi:hypothetical protein